MTVDVHAHFLPAFYRDALVAQGHAQPDGMPSVPEWSAAEHVSVMDRLAIDTAMLSISSPGVHVGDDPVALTQACNDAGLATVSDHPGRFGLFASLPLPDVDAAVREVERVGDRVDGFALLTNVGGAYVGSADHAPLFAELDRRRATVFLHPTSPCGHEHVAHGRPRPMLEFLFDTTRAVVDLVLNGVIARYPHIDWIVPHAGATLPMVADRVEVFALVLGAEVDVLGDLRRLHYDLAGYPLPRQLDALLTLTDPDHLHYGSDYPFTPEFAVAASRARLAATDVWDGLVANTDRLLRRDTP